jgi:O-antigen/teichoic acid export membrane protein
VVVVVIFEWWGTTPAHFFGYQLLVAVVETTLLAARTYQLMPDVPPGTNIGFHFKPLAAVLRLSLSVAFTGAVWVAVTQIDKLMLSGLLPLSEYAHFTLAVLVASGVTIVSGPLSSALLPRLTRLHAQQDHAGLIKLYRQATQAMGVIVMPVALVLAFSAEPLLRAWTGDAVLAAKSAPILRLYALGNGILALAAFPYYLQFAKGDVRLHLVGNLLFLLLLVPGIMFAVSKFGAAGAGWAWLGANGIYAVLWVPLVHRRFAVGLHRVWLIVDVVPVLIAVVSSVWIMTLLVKWPSHRSGIAFNLAFIMLIALLAGIFASSYARSWLFQRLNFRITR